MLEWREDLNDMEWDELLTSMKGHPLQSTIWGNSKKRIDGINDSRWVAFKDGIPVYLVRFETRYFLKKIKIAWIPRGPVVFDRNHESFSRIEFLTRLKKLGFFFCCEAPWRKVERGKETKSDFFTIWVDLKLGKERLWENLNKQFRYDVRRSKKLGVSVHASKSSEDLRLFYLLCKKLSLSKEFYFPVSFEFMLNLLQKNSQTIETLLFVARHEGTFCGGAFIIRCGDCVHYMWGAVDRLFSHLSIGQAIQWEVIEWALSRNCIKYDLEGITRKKNSGVDNFKKKIGGELVSNPGLQIYSFNIFTKQCGHLVKSYLFILTRLKEFKIFLLNHYCFNIFNSKHIKTKFK